MVYNSLLFTIEYKAAITEVQELFETMRRRGASFSWSGKTEYRVFIPEHLPYGAFVDALRLSEVVYWVDDKVEVRTYCPSLRG